jgi:hypothetical protein
MMEGGDAGDEKHTKLTTGDVADKWGFPSWYGRPRSDDRLPWERQEAQETCTDRLSVLLFIGEFLSND